MSRAVRWGADDAFDLATVDAEVAGYGALAAPAWCRPVRSAPPLACPLARVAHRALLLVQPGCVTVGWLSLDVWFGPDQGHEEFEGASQSEGGPGADQCADGAVAQAMGQVGADGGGDAGPRHQRANGGTGWWRRLASRMSMLAARISPSTVKGSSLAVRPLSPWVVTSS